MIFFIFTFILLAYLVSAPIWYFGRKRVNWFAWDYGVPVYGITAWICLLLLGVGKTASLSNAAAELFWICLSTLLSPALRLAMPGQDKISKHISSIGLALLPVAMAITARLTMPTLPE